MSKESVEIARRAIDAWNSGDMDALRDLYDPHAVMRLPSDWVDPGPYMGRDAIMGQFGQLREVWSEQNFFDRIDLFDAGDRVVVQVEFYGDARGLPLSTKLAWVYTVRDGLIVSIEFFHSRDEAFDVLELRE